MVKMIIPMNKAEPTYLHGSDRAWDVLGEQVTLWEEYRSGYLEQLAETIMKGGISIDAGLDEMVRNGIIPEWRIKNNAIISEDSNLP